MALPTLAVLVALAITSLAQEQSPQLPRALFCTASPEEQAFCEATVPVMTEAAPTVGWGCVSAAEGQDCAQSVAAGASDITITGAAGIYSASSQQGLQAIVAEDRGRGDAATYYSIAIVAAELCTPDVTFEALRGQTMCSTGYGRTAGWSMPVGYMASAGLFGDASALAGVNENVSGDAQAIAGFFGEVCAVGNNTNGPVLLGDNQTAQWTERFCGACEDPATCTQDDQFYDYPGVYRGVAEGACAVGFTRQDIVAEYSIGGAEAQEWAPDANSFRLLCPQGRCAPVDQFETCTIAKVPSRSVLVRGDYEGVEGLQQAFVALGSSEAFQAAVLNSTANPEDYLIQASTVAFIPITTDTPTYLGAAGTAIAEIQRLTGQAKRK